MLPHIVSCQRYEYSTIKLGETEIPNSDQDSSMTILVQLYLPSAMYDERKQYLIYDITNFTADFGGYLGLLLGSSLLSLYDTVKRWLKTLYKLLSEKLARNNGNDQTPNSA